MDVSQRYNRAVKKLNADPKCLHVIYALDGNFVRYRKFVSDIDYDKAIQRYFKRGVICVWAVHKYKRS